MGVIDTKIFWSGDDAAVILPKDTAFAPGTSVTVEQCGDVLTIRPVIKRRSLSEMAAALRALGPVGEIGERDPIEFPERPGM